ncbi:MAG: hypothetical protein ACLQU1_30565 [Bryobacteraceae bacterium]
MVYTCYEMVRDCRADRPEGWSYFIANYVPVIRKLLAHYAGGRAPALEGVLAGLRKPESSLFASLEPAPERWFVGELRQKVVAALAIPEAAAPLDLETLAAALQPLTMVEKQAAWLETMGYGPPETGAMLRMAPTTVEKIRGRAGELLRGAVDTWNRTLLPENGPALGRAAAAAHTDDCLLSKTFLDMLDGRSTWRTREQIERHATTCWHCIDHFCRMAEVVELLRGVEPLPEAELEPFRKLLGIREEKPGGWKRWFGGAL